VAHFAKIEDNIVVDIVVVNNEDVEDGDGVEQESIGIAFLKNLFGNDTEWVQTSYNNNFRKNYAGVGFTYDQTRDAFIPPQPYPSWILDEDTCCWDAPIPYPLPEEKEAFSGSFDHVYEWDEDNVTWKVQE